MVFPFKDARTVNALRQWAELAHWFPSRSGPIGAQRLCHMLQTDSQQAPSDAVCTIEEEDFSRYSADGRAASHSSLVQQRLFDVWKAFETIRVKLGY